MWGPGIFAAPGLVLADEVAAMIASGIILITAVRLITPALREGTAVQIVGQPAKKQVAASATQPATTTAQ